MNTKNSKCPHKTTMTMKKKKKMMGSETLKRLMGTEIRVFFPLSPENHGGSHHHWLFHSWTAICNEFSSKQTVERHTLLLLQFALERERERERGDDGGILHCLKAAGF